jgi:hypothetical protein
MSHDMAWRGLGCFPPDQPGRASIDRGLGQRLIVRFLDNVPGINDGAVQQQLANLKSSGD